jgi:phage terminase Nu1 subunit (DNA packaging protein)
VIRWLLNYKDAQISRAKQPSTSIEESEARKSRLQADMLELKLQIARSEVIDIEKIGREFDDVHSAIRSILLGIPKHAARELANKEIETYLETFIRKSLEELSSIPTRIDRFKELSTTADTIDADLFAASNTDSKPMGGSEPGIKPRSKRRKRPVADVKS